MQEEKIDFETRYYDREPLSTREWEELVGERPVGDFLNPRSGPYKELGLKDRKLTRAEFIRLVRTDPNLLKRPLVVKGSRYIFGTDPEAYRSL